MHFSFSTNSTRLLIRASRLIPLLLGTCAIGALTSLADPPKPDPKPAETITLQRLYKPREVNRYKMENHVSFKSPMGEMEGTVTMTYKETVKESKEDGTATLLLEFEKTSGSFGGMEQDLTDKMPKVTLSREKKGKFTAKSEGGDAMLGSVIAESISSMYETQNAIYVSKPVKVGESWKITIATSALPGQNINSSGNATLVGWEEISGQKTLKIKFVTDSDANAQLPVKLHGESLYNIDPQSGRALRLTSKTTGDIAGTAIKNDITLTLLTDEKKPEGEKKAEGEKKPDPEKKDK